MRASKPFLLACVAVTLAGVGLVGCKPAAAPAATERTTAKAAAKFHCPMHPTYLSDRPGDCPICGMRLIPIKHDGADSLAQGQGSPTGVPGRATVALSADKRQLIGLTLTTVESRDLTTTISAPGVVQHDERRAARISPRFGGWVRHLAVNFTNAPIEKGGELFTVYSPEVYATENDYLTARRALLDLPTDASAGLRATAQALLDATKLRLALWEIGDEELRKIEERGTASQELVYRAPLSGHVVAKTAVEGKAFMAGDTLFEIADLSHVWVQARVAGAELSNIAIGQEATVSFPDAGNLVMTATVTFIDPHLDPQTRRGTVRLELDNPGHQLRLEMWASVEIEIPLGRKLTVPADAVIDTGKRYLAFVDGDAGHLEPRVVKVGVKTDAFYEVREGLKEGERVVSRALFLVDSESQLRAAISGMGETSEHKH